jgi:hypothetical protein
MTKWIWKLYEQKDSMWVKLLRAKYMKDDDFFKLKSNQGSQFWKSLHKVKHLFKWGGAVHKIGNGKMTQFWNGVWFNIITFESVLPKIVSNLL